MADENGQFVALKFLEDDEVVYEVGLTKWLLSVAKDKQSRTYWPPKPSLVSSYLKRGEDPNPDTWHVCPCHIKKYYDTYLLARNGLKGFLAESSAYESEIELGRGQRKRKVKCIESDSNSDSSKISHNRKKIKKLLSPPKQPAFSVAGSASPKRNVVFKSTHTAGKNTSNVTKTKNVLQNIRASKKSSLEKLQDRLKESRTGALSKKEAFQNSIISQSIEKPKKDLRSGKSPSNHAAAFKKRMLLKSSRRDELSPAKTNYNFPSPSPKKPQDFQIQPLVLQEPTLARESSYSVDHEELEGTLTPTHQDKEDHHPSSRDTLQCSPSPVMSVKSRGSPSPMLRRMNATLGSSSEGACKRALFMSPEKQNDISSSCLCDANGVADTLKDIYKRLEKVEKLDRRINILHQQFDCMNSKLDVTIMNQGRLNRSLLPREKKITRPSGLPSLPLKSLSELENFEKFLEKNHNLTATCDYLESFSIPNNESAAMTFVMSKLLTDSVASEFNFDGHGQKIGFKSLKLWSAVQGTLATVFPKSQLEEGIKTLRSWLVNAPWRKSGGKRQQSSSTTK